MSRIALACGPTGGHLIPALVTAGRFRELDVEISLYSTASSSHPLFKDFPGSYRQLKLKHWPGTNFSQKSQACFEMVRCFFKTFRPLASFDALLSFGGYPAVPLLAGAVFRGVPIYLQEQNRLPGKTTLLFSNFATQVFYGLPPCKRGKENNSLIVGNPIRKFIPREDPWFTHAPLLVVMGGSQGSRELSRNLAHTAGELLENDWHIYYVKGKFGLDLADRFTRGDNFRQVKFDRDLLSALAQSQCVWARAGAETISELVACELPAVIFPYQAAADSHQQYNARWICERGPARIAGEISEEQLGAVTQKLSESSESYQYNDEINDSSENVIVDQILSRIS